MITQTKYWRNRNFTHSLLHTEQLMAELPRHRFCIQICRVNDWTPSRILPSRCWVTYIYSLLCCQSVFSKPIFIPAPASSHLPCKFSFLLLLWDTEECARRAPGEHQGAHMCTALFNYDYDLVQFKWATHEPSELFFSSFFFFSISKWGF